jgi:multidrug efflux pump subunit AcrA (membrane-fusion protein)
MFRKYVLPLLALAGAVFAVKTVTAGAKPQTVAQPVAKPAVSPFERFVAGAGLVEASSEDVAIGTTQNGLVVEVAGKVGDVVAAGAPLFRLDDRTLRGQRGQKLAAVAAAKARLDRLEQQPRAEDLPPLEASVKVAEVALADAQEDVARWESVKDERAVSQEQLARKRFAVAGAQARLAAAQADLARTKAGAWSADVAVARAELQSAQAEVDALDLELDRLVVRAPIAGTLLQVKVHAGEYAQAGVLAQPLVLLGATSPLHVRVDVDENDAWRVKPGARGHANVRGNRELDTALEFVRFEPFVVPKRSLTGDATERVDTRVLQVVFRVVRKDLPLFVGQQMDVFVDEGGR